MSYPETQSARWDLAQQVAVDIGRVLFGSLFMVRVHGRDHIPPNGGGLIVCNHPTLIEPVLLQLFVPRRTSQLAAPSPWKYPSLAYFLDLFESICIEPSEGPRAAVQKAVNVIRAGRLVVVFPEGEHRADGSLGAFRSGAARIALAADCPVIPAAVCGSQNAFPRGTTLPRLCPISIRFGQPFRLRTHARPLVAMRRGTARMHQEVSRLLDP